MSKAHKPSICFVIPKYVTFSTGGAEIQVHYLANEFLERGWSVEIVCGGKRFKHSIAKSQYLDSRIKYHYYQNSNLRFLEFFLVFFLLHKTRSEVYYQRTDFALTGAVALFCRTRKRKMIYALAHDYDAYRNKYLTEYKKYHYNSKLKKAIRRIDFWLVDKMVEWGKGKSHLVIAQNNEQKKAFETHFKKTCHIIPSSYPVKKESDPIKEKVILWVGNMSNVKRPEIFIDLVNQLKGIDDWIFVMVGKIDPQIEKLDTTRINITGELSYDETLRWFEKAALFISTSEGEGMPNVFIQAWLKRALVLSLVVDPDQLLKEKKLGFVFDNQAEQLKTFIEAYISQPRVYDQVSDNAFEYAISTYNVSNNVDCLIHLIKAL